MFPKRYVGQVQNVELYSTGNVRVTILAVEKQYYIFCVCVSLSL
jgi:hypothetical protein